MTVYMFITVFFHEKYRMNFEETLHCCSLHFYNDEYYSVSLAYEQINYLSSVMYKSMKPI